MHLQIVMDSNGDTRHGSIRRTSRHWSLRKLVSRS